MILSLLVYVLFFVAGIFCSLIYGHIWDTASCIFLGCTSVYTKCIILGSKLLPSSDLDFILLICWFCKPVFTQHSSCFQFTSQVLHWICCTFTIITWSIILVCIANHGCHGNQVLCITMIIIGASIWTTDNHWLFGTSSAERSSRAMQSTMNRHFLTFLCRKANPKLLNNQRTATIVQYTHRRYGCHPPSSQV